MRRETTAFLELVRAAEDPTPVDEERVRRALRAAIAAGAVPIVAAGHGNETWTVSKLGALGSKLNVLAVCTAAALGTGDNTLQAARRDAAPTTGARPALPGASTSPSLTLRELTPAKASAPPNADSANELSTAVPEAGLRRAPKANAPLASSSPRRATPAPPRALGPELELLQRVQSALRGGNAALALNELDAHQTDDRSLLAERQASRIVALCMLRRTSEARFAARDFFLQHPDSIHREAISSACTNLQRIDDP